MAPKKVAKAKTKTKSTAAPIEKPVVSDSDYAAAKKLLENEEELKRQRSCLSFFLESRGQKEEYADWSREAKKEFLIIFLADRLASGKLKSTMRTFRTVDSVDTNKRSFEWWNKKQMIDTWGEAKAIARINSGKLKTQPDEVTGEHGEFLTEYQIWFGTGGTESSDRNRSEVGGEEEIDSAEKAATAQGIIDDTARALLCETGSAANSSASNADSEETQIKQEPMAPTPGSETMKTIKSNARKVLRACGDTITELKFMFEKSKGDVYQEPLLAEIQKLIPKMSTSFKALESVAVKPADYDDASLLAVSKKLDDQYDTYNKLSSVFDRMNPKERSAKKPKT